jgi:hypothetical protein
MLLNRRLGDGERWRWKFAQVFHVKIKKLITFAWLFLNFDGLLNMADLLTLVNQAGGK